MHNVQGVFAATVNRLSSGRESIRVMVTNRNLKARSDAANRFDGRLFAERHDKTMKAECDWKQLYALLVDLWQKYTFR